MRLCFFGAGDPSYPRQAVIKKGLSLNGVEVSQCWIAQKYKFWSRYPLLFFRWLRFCRKIDFFLVPEFCQKDVPLAKILSTLISKKIIFDPLASRYETKISDWKRKPAHSLSAWWNFEIDRWAFKLADLVLADTHAHKNYYCQKYKLSPNKVEVLPVGFDDSLYKPFSSQPQEKRDRFTVLFYGSFLPLHGVEVIIQAADIVFKEDRFLKFKLVGSGQTLNKIRTLSSRLGLRNVYFEGWLPQEELVQRIDSADICLGIFGETEKARRVVPHKIFQSMAMKKAVITSRTPAVEEFFTHRENIFLLPEPRPELLAKAILELKKDKLLREKIALEGYELVRQKFSPQAIGRVFLEIIRRNFRHGL